MESPAIAIVISAGIIIGLLYFILLRPKLQQRKAINQTREWLYREMGISDSSPTSERSVTLPPGVQVITDIRAVWGYPPKQNEIFEEIFLNEDNENWNYTVHIHEATEQYLGSTIFESLQKRFSSADGIDECLQEDREIFLIRTKALDTQGVRETLWNKFLEAAKESFEEGKKK